MIVGKATIVMGHEDDDGDDGDADGGHGEYEGGADDCPCV